MLGEDGHVLVDDAVGPVEAGGEGADALGRVVVDGPEDLQPAVGDEPSQVVDVPERPNRLRLLLAPLGCLGRGERVVERRVRVGERQPERLGIVQLLRARRFLVGVSRRSLAPPLGIARRGSGARRRLSPPGRLSLEPGVEEYVAIGRLTSCCYLLPDRLQGSGGRRRERLHRGPLARSRARFRGDRW